MKKITLTNNFHNSTASFISQKSRLNPEIFVVSYQTQRRVFQELCGNKHCMCKNSIELYSGEDWEVVGIDEHKNLKIRFK